MPEGKKKSHSFRRLKLVTPGGTKKIHYVRRPSKRARCKICGTSLNASKKLDRKRLNSLSKTERRAERSYGGSVCGHCLRKAIEKATRRMYLVKKA